MLEPYREWLANSEGLWRECTVNKVQVLEETFLIVICSVLTHVQLRIDEAQPFALR